MTMKGATRFGLWGILFVLLTVYLFKNFEIATRVSELESELSRIVKSQTMSSGSGSSVSKGIYRWHTSSACSREQAANKIEEILVFLNKDPGWNHLESSDEELSAKVVGEYHGMDLEMRYEKKRLTVELVRSMGLYFMTSRTDDWGE